MAGTKGHDRRTVVFEGMYNGMAKQIEEAKEELRAEIRANAEKQQAAIEELSRNLREGIGSVLKELRYLAEQSSAIYEFDEKARFALRRDIVSAVNARLDAKIKRIRCDLHDYENGIPVPDPAEEPDPPVSKRGEGLDEMSDYVGHDVLDYALLAEKISALIPETDYSLLAEKVAAAVPRVDEETLAERLSEVVPITDYDLIAQRVTALLTETAPVGSALTEDLSAEDRERIAVRVAELLGGDPNAVPEGESVSEESEAVTPGEATPEENDPSEEEMPEEAAEEEDADDEPEEEAAEEIVSAEGRKLRCFRSFEAKLILSDDGAKRRYSELKNTLLSYAGVNSRLGLRGDRFYIGRETVARILFRGRSLSVCFALDPAEFPEGVYHQKDLGKVKQYASTPMLVKLKTESGLKRAVRLAHRAMRGRAVVTGRTPVDYGALYPYRDEAALLEEGLIKPLSAEGAD